MLLRLRQLLIASDVAPDFAMLPLCCQITPPRADAMPLRFHAAPRFSDACCRLLFTFTPRFSLLRYDMLLLCDACLR